LFLFETVIIEAPHRAYGSGCASLRFGRDAQSGSDDLCGGTTQLGSLFGKDKSTAS
jgi:hypothetical protein